MKDDLPIKYLGNESEDSPELDFVIGAICAAAALIAVAVVAAGIVVVVWK